MPEARRVHIIDDEESIRKSLGFLLTSSGYQVHSWASGPAFLKGAATMESGCVLLDVHMPEMNGLDVHAHMARSGIGLPVILLTGHGDVSLAVRAMKCGVSDFIEKPFDSALLLNAVERAFQAIDRSTMRRDDQAAAEVRISLLTDREREVLDGLACGYPNKTIAYDLGISSRTVEVHRAHLMTKLRAANFADALRIAFAAGLGDAESWERRGAAAGHSPVDRAPVDSHFH